MIGIYIIFAIILMSYIIINKHEIINDTFWLLASWSLIIITYLFSGYRPTGKIQADTWLYIIACLGGFIFFEKIGMGGKKNAEIFNNHKDDRQNISEHEISIVYFIIGILGTSIYVFDLYIQNGALATGFKTSLEVSIIGAIANLFYPINYVYYVNGLSSSIFLSKKITIKTFISAIAYIIPCVVQSGRENIILIMISTVAIFIYGSRYKKNFIINEIDKIRSRKQVLLVIFGGIMALLVFMYVSQTRYSDNEAKSFFNYNSEYLPSRFMEETNKLGTFKNVYLNMFQYYCAQIPSLDLIIRYYKGPFLFGLFNFNMISRRLPISWGLNYADCFLEINNIYLEHGTRFFVGGWATALGSMIPDFNILGTFVICCILGFCIGRSKYKLFYEWNSMRIGLQAIFCMEMYYTVQIGPLFQFPLWGIILWWFIIYKVRISTIRLNIINEQN